MASVAGHPAYRQMTVDEFLALDIEGRAELEDGVLYMMSGGSFRHAAIAANIIASFRVSLRGSGCRPMTSDFAVRTGPATVRMPDVSVYCGLPTTPEQQTAQLLGDPALVVEVLSPSTSRQDQKVKLDEYRALEGTDVILFVDPDVERVRIVERTGPEAWTDRWLSKGEDVVLTKLGITLPHAEIFAED